MLPLSQGPAKALAARPRYADKNNFHRPDQIMNTSTTKPEEYDLVVLGSGAGGKLIAWTSAQKGERVAVIERKYVGGSCPNIACLPSKNIIHSAKVASFFGRSEEF